MTPARRRPSCSCANSARAMRAKPASPAAMLPMLAKIAEPSPDPHAPLRGERGAPAVLDADPARPCGAALPPRSRRPIVVLEPSAGTGLLAILAELAGASLVLNELAETRAGLLVTSFPASPSPASTPRRSTIISTPAIVPSVVLMNPPFSAMAQCRSAAWRTRPCATSPRRWRVCAEGGRLVAITGASFAPDNPAWRDAFVRLQEHGRVVFTAAIDGAVYAKHGTTIDTRLTVIDKLPADDPTRVPGIAGHRARCRHAARLGRRSTFRRGCRSSRRTSPSTVASRPIAAHGRAPIAARRPPRPRSASSRRRSNSPTRPSTGRRPRAARITDALYEDYALQSIRIPGAQAHPTKLVQSAAMASVAPPKPTYRPHLAGERRRRRPAVRRPARNRHLCRRGPCRVSRRLLDGRRDLRRRRRRARRRRERRPLSARLVSGRRHRRRQGPAGRRHPARQLAEGPPPCGLDQQVRQADRGRAARLVGARHGAPARHAAVALPPGHADPARRKASCSRPTPRCAPTSAARSFRASSRSSNGWAPTSTA